MKIELTDTTFLIIVRLDSMQRLENLLVITNMMTEKFITNIYIREAASYNNNILRKLLHHGIHYEFIEDKDPVLHKTKHINQMASQVETPYLAVWDADVVLNKDAVISCLEELRSKRCDIAFPYDGMCYDVPETIKPLFFRKKDIRVLLRHKGKMELLYKQVLVGGAVLMKRTSYIQAGMENEQHYGWGNDDWDRYSRFVGLGYVVYRVTTSLFHLSHTRGANSFFRSSIAYQISKVEYLKNRNISKFELQERIQEHKENDEII